MGLTPGTWYVEAVRGGYIIRAESESSTKIVRGSGGFARHADALACAYLPELIAAARSLLETAGRWHASDDAQHRVARPLCSDCEASLWAATSRMRELLDLIGDW